MPDRVKVREDAPHTPEQLQAEREDELEQLNADARFAEDADLTAEFVADPLLDPAVRDALSGADVRWRRSDEAPRASGTGREATEADAREIYIGRIPPTTAAALQVIGSAEQLWCALAELEPAGRTLPTASLTNRVAERETAMAVLDELAERYGSRALFLEQPSGRKLRFQVLGAAIGAVRKLVGVEIDNLRRELETRSIARDQIAIANASAKGARGPANEPARRRRMLEQLDRLRVHDAWNLQRIAELVVESVGWRKPPCRSYVDELLGVTDSRPDAIKRLYERLRVTERRSS